MVKVVVLDPIHEDGLALLRGRGDINLVHLPAPTDADISHHISDAEILLLRGRHLKRRDWQSAHKLSLVTRHGVGCDNIDFGLMQERGVTVAITADANYVSVAEHACTLMLAACRNLVEADAASRAGAWTRRDNLGARELRGARVLVVGFGRIGRAFTERARAFETKITVFDPYMTTGEVLPPDVERAMDLSEAVGQADIVSLHLPHTPGTQGLFNGSLLSRCRPGSILINTGRGGIVDETALIEALDAGRPALYATDVLTNEPPARDDPLLERRDVIITPHSAAMTLESARYMAVGAAQNALDFLDGTLPRRMIAFDPSQSAKEGIFEGKSKSAPPFNDPVDQKRTA